MKLKGKKVKARIKTLRAIPYKGHMIYIRQINNDIFEWLLIFRNQLYGSYIVVKPDPSGKKPTEIDINKVTNLVLAGATTTLETLSSKLDEDIKEAGKSPEKLLN